MCLDTRFKPEVEKKMIAKLPDGLITVYRVVRLQDSRYKAVFAGSVFKVGLNHAKVSKSCRVHIPTKYKPGYHSFETSRDADLAWFRSFIGVGTIKYQIRKEWITAIGKEGGHLVYVTDRIISPSLRDKSAVVE